MKKNSIEYSTDLYSLAPLNHGLRSSHSLRISIPFILGPKVCGERSSAISLVRLRFPPPSIPLPEALARGSCTPP